MTEEIEAHVLKKYEILQKLGKSLQKSFIANFAFLALLDPNSIVWDAKIPLFGFSLM